MRDECSPAHEALTVALVRALIRNGTLFEADIEGILADLADEPEAAALLQALVIEARDTSAEADFRRSKLRLVPVRKEEGA